MASTHHFIPLKLSVFCDEMFEGEYEIHQVACTLGRDTEKADIVLTSDLVSREHLKLFWTPQGVLVQDLQSANGTRLEGSKVAISLSLFHKSFALRVGPYRLEVTFSTIAHYLEQELDSFGQTISQMAQNYQQQLDNLVRQIEKLQTMQQFAQIMNPDKIHLKLLPPPDENTVTDDKTNPQLPRVISLKQTIIKKNVDDLKKRFSY